MLKLLNFRHVTRIAPRFGGLRSFSAPAPEFLNGTTSNYADAQLEAWTKDPDSVHPSWKAFFETGQFQTPGSAPSMPITSTAPAASQQKIEATVRLVQMVRHFQVRGHFLANVDPLGLQKKESDWFHPGDLSLERYKFTEADLNTTFDLGSHSLLDGFLASDEHHRKMTLGQIYERLKEAYCGNIGFEYMHISNREQTAWLQNKIETPVKDQLTKDERLVMLDRLIWAHSFEKFLQLKWTAQKRFGLDGLESLIPGMKAIVDLGGELGVENVVLGMPHRGRLSVLSTVLRKPLEEIFHEFSGPKAKSDDQYGSGDVKYHLGASTDRVTNSGKKIHMSLVANPSHLEAADPVVVGKTRAKQNYSGDTDGTKNLALILHGDAAFAAQGVVFETFAMTDVPDYTTGGVLHIICNNQIGFTTDPSCARSSPYCTDVAKTVGAPIFHVNGDDVESVVRACQIATEFRQKFKKDAIVDIVGYRKYGHNEGDEPRFTQPQMYGVIDNHPDSLSIYTEKLIKEGHITDAEAKAMKARVHEILQDGFEKSKNFDTKAGEWLDSNWAGFLESDKISHLRLTGVNTESLKNIGKSLVKFPAGFNMHRRLKKIFDTREKSLTTGENIDWGTAEGLAFGTLLQEGCHVRLSGEDSQRGTFSHRHAVVHDQKTPEVTHMPLEHVPHKKAHLSVSNSPLSEFGVLGYEYGYSLESPRSLVIWEAQFGDFANGAQTIFDQFVSSGESKWLRQSGLVCLLPHGYEGGGPEHSSGRMERFLQMCDDRDDVIPENRSLEIQSANWQIVNCSTPANYFHVLRRQIHRDFRKPLIVFTPKSLLKLRECVSTYEDMAEGTKFQRVYKERFPEKINSGDKIRRLILCSGKVYYELVAEREKRGIKDIAILTIEQLSPFPYDVIERLGSEIYPKAEFMWCQEEPQNMGAWAYVQPRIETSLEKTRDIEPIYAGREPAASPATGRGAATHKAEIAEFMDEAFRA